VSRRYRLAALVFVVLGWGLRLRNLGGPELWFDEAASHFIAARPPADILSYVASAPFEHPPLYYLLLNVAMRFLGETEWALRFPSVLLGVVLLTGLWRAGTSLAGLPLGLAVVSFAAVSPFLITYAQEARMYALLQCLGLLSTALLHRALLRPGWTGWLPYGLTMALGLATHYFFAFLLPAHALMAVVLEPVPARSALRRVALAGAALVAAGALAIVLLPGPRAAAEQMLRESLWGKSPEAVGRLLLDWAYGGAIITDRPSWAQPLSALALLLPLVGLAAAVLTRRTRAGMGLWILVPTAIAIAIPYGGLVLRHFSYVAPALCLLAGAGLLALGRRSRALGVLGIAVVAATALPGLVWLGASEKGHYRDAMAHLSQRHRPDDVLLLGNPHQWVPFTYYNRSGLESLSVGDGRPLPVTEVEGAGRVWLLEWETWAVPDIGQVRQGLSEHAAEAYRLELSQDVRLTLLYRLPAGGAERVAPWSWSERYAVGEAWAWTGSLVPGDAVLARICWHAQPPAADTAVLVLRLSDADGRVWAESTQPAGTNRRSADARCTDHALSIPGGTPPGGYRAELGLVELPGGAQVAATAADGTALGPWVSLGEFDVAAAPYPPPPIIAGTGGELAGGLRLLGSETDRSSLSAGSDWDGIVQVTTEAAGAPAALPVRLVGAGRETALGTWSPASGATGSEVLRCPLTVRLPADLPAGEYRLEVGGRVLGGLQAVAARLGISGAGWATVDTFSVTARTLNRVGRTPGSDLGVTFGGSVGLYELDQQLDGEHLRLTLYWEALAPVGESYKAFVHLARPGEDEPVAQDDRPPANVPTGEWLVGETFTSEHVLALPGEGESLRLRVGLYSERTMERLAASGPGTAVDHVELLVEPGGLIVIP